MGRRQFFLERLAEGADLPTEPLPWQSVVEIAGQTRVLIENHLGVKGYSREKIVVKVKFGSIAVCGENLEMTRMTRDQLVILGGIQCVSLHRG